MANVAKPSADLLWAFQLHREHGALSKRLKLLESTTTQQQDRISADEQSARAAYDERLNALANQLQTLQETEVTEQVAGLASELRATRRQVDQARDKVRSIESASKETEGKLQEREQVVHARFGNLESTLAQVQRALLDFEGRLQLAAQHGARVAPERLEETRQRHHEEMAGLRERLRGLQDAQSDLRALVEGVVRDGQQTPAAVPNLDQTTTVPLNTTATSHVSAAPDPQYGVATLLETVAAPPSSSTASHTTLMPHPQQKQTVPDQTTPAPSSSTASRITIKPNPKPAKAKAVRRFSKEIASLINGEGSLTNAPDIMYSQLPPEISKGGGKKRKAPAGEGPLLRLTLTQRETRSQAKRVKEEPPATRAKVPVKAAKKAVAETKPASKKGTTRQAANTTTATRDKREPRRNLRHARSPTLDRPMPLPTSDEIQVTISQEVVESRTPTPLPVASRGKGKGKGKGKIVVEREQQKQQPRRRIKQDDSMEEFLAKCRASTGGPGGGGGD